MSIFADLGLGDPTNISSNTTTTGGSFPLSPYTETYAPTVDWAAMSGQLATKSPEELAIIDWNNNALIPYNYGVDNGLTTSQEYALNAAKSSGGINDNTVKIIDQILKWGLPVVTILKTAGVIGGNASIDNIANEPIDQAALIKFNANTAAKAASVSSATTTDNSFLGIPFNTWLLGVVLLVVGSLFFNKNKNKKSK